MKRYSMYIDEAEEKPDGEWVVAEEALALEASLDMADRAGLELAKQLEVANARVAELERIGDEDLLNRACDERDAARKERDAANARADAAKEDAAMWNRQAAEQKARADAAERKHQRWAIEHARAERAEAEALALRARVELCHLVLSRRFEECAHMQSSTGELCWADELEAALGDK